MGFNIHILSVRNRSTNLHGHAALAASFNPTRFNLTVRCSRMSCTGAQESATTPPKTLGPNSQSAPQPIQTRGTAAPQLNPLYSPAALVRLIVKRSRFRW